MLEEISNSIVALTIPDAKNILINAKRPIEQQTLREPHHSGRIVWQPNRFMSGGEALEAETIRHEDNLYTYNEVMHGGC